MLSCWHPICMYFCMFLIRRARLTDRTTAASCRHTAVAAGMPAEWPLLLRLLSQSEMQNGLSFELLRMNRHALHSLSRARLHGPPALRKNGLPLAALPASVGLCQVLFRLIWVSV